jgi:hypothetical protein
MSCQEFWNTLADGNVRHPHLAECPDCARKAGRHRELRSGLRALAAEREHVQAPPQVEDRLIAAFRAQAATRASERSRIRWIPAAAWAGAVAAMLAIGVLAVRDRLPQAKHPATTKNVELAVLENTRGFENGEDDGFMPLPGAAQLGPAENLDLVRVELPRSAMMQVGIEVSPERAAEKIQADVMVGADGLARSVRFVEISGSD